MERQKFIFKSLTWFAVVFLCVFTCLYLKSALADSTTIQKPLEGMNMSSGFLPTRTLSGSSHLSSDYWSSITKDIHPFAEGTVVKVVTSVKTVDRSGNNARGNYVIIKHTQFGVGTIYSFYQHMQYGSVKVTEGQHVGLDTVLGKVGDTGYTYGAHLHFTITTSIDDPRPKSKTMHEVYGYPYVDESKVKTTNYDSITVNGVTWFNPGRVFTTNGEILGIYQTTDNERQYCRAVTNVVCYDSPRTDANHPTTIPNGYGIIIEGKYTDPATKKAWYKTKNGYWIKPEQVTSPKSFPSQMAKGSETKETSKPFTAIVTPRYGIVYLESEPYSTYVNENDHKGMIPIKENEPLTVKNVWINKHGNYWLEFSNEYNGYFLCANNVIEIACTESKDVWIDGQIFPENDLTLGKGFDIKGTVKSSYDITEVTGGVYDPFYPYPQYDAKFVKTLTYQTPIKTLNLYTSNINVASRGGISFGKLPKGIYAFRLTVKYNKLIWRDVTDAKQPPYIIEPQTKVFQSNFTVGMGKESEAALGDIVDEVKVTGITLNMTSKNMSVGEIISLVETIKPSNATNPKVSWSSSDPTVAKVENGKVTAVGKGTAVITVTAEDGSQKNATCTVTVRKLPVSISISGEHDLYWNDNASKTVQLTATVLDADASDTSVTWSSTNENIATVSNNGFVTAIGNGIATIKATANGNPSVVTQCRIEVKSYVTGLEIEGQNEVAIDGNTQYKAIITPSTASDPTIIWSTNKSDVATVDYDGTVHGVAQGTTTITATAQDRNIIIAQKEITVYQPIKEISISGTNALTVGNTATLTANVLPSNADIRRVDWSSDNDSIATVSQQGAVTAVGNGIVTITASSHDDPTINVTHEIKVTTLVSSLSFADFESVDVGSDAQIGITINPDTASNKKLNWSIDDETLASIDSNGMITGLSPGFVTVTATTTDGTDISATLDLEVVQKVQSISVDIPPVAYVGEVIYPDVIVLPENASYPRVVWSSSNEDLVAVQDVDVEEQNTDVDSWTVAKCVGVGTIRLTASATDGSGVSGYAYVRVRKNTELQRHTMTFDLLTTGNGRDSLGRVALLADSAFRAAEAGYGAVWSIEHVSGNYASLIGITEEKKSYDSFTLANAAAINLLRVNHAGSDVYRVSCTINGSTDTCEVTINVTEPENPLPESVTLSTATLYGTVGQSITMDSNPVCSPAGSALPDSVSRYLYGVNAFNRYAEVTSNENSFTVRFTKGGTYTARVQFQGANYEYDAPVSFVITDPDGILPPEVESLSFDDSVHYMLAGETNQLIVNIEPAGADETALMWSSSDTAIATVDQSGNVTAVGNGVAIITVGADNGVTETALVYVTDSLLSIDWNANNTIRVFVDGNTRTSIQKVYLTPRAQAYLTEAPVWSLKRKEGNNLTLTYNPIVSTGENSETEFGCEIILKSVSLVGTTEYELSCSDGIHTATTTIRVSAENAQDVLPSLISWQNSTFTGDVGQLMVIYPNVVCWPDGTSLPDAVTVSFEGDSYWNNAINVKDYTISRDMMTFSFNEPGVYTANCIYSCSNMRYLVPVTLRIRDADGNVPVRVSKLALNADEISIESGSTFQLNAFVSPDDATNKVVTWSVDDSGVATVSDNGLVTGVANGRTTVWCTPSDTSCDPVKCVVVVEDEFTITQTEEMSFQYLQGETGNAVAGFSLSKGTAKRIESEGLTPTWSMTKVSGEAADAVLQEHNGVMYIAVTALKKGGEDIYEVTCNAGSYSWTGRATLQVSDLGSSAPESVTIANTQYTADVNEEIELDFTPVCQPASALIPSELRASYIGIGDFYQGLVDSYRMSVLTATGDTIAVSFKKPGVYVLSRFYRSCNLSYVTECTINVGAGKLNLLKCTDPEPVVYIGGKSGIASTCILSDISIEELYGADLIWNAERLSGDCLTVALMADQSSASLYVVNAKETGSELWRVSCTFHGITSYVDVTIHAVASRTELPETVSLYQTEFDGMIGRNISVPLAVTCVPEGTALPETSEDAWSFVTDGFGMDYATWAFADDQMKICFTESGYYGGNLVYESGNVRYEFPVSFAIVDEESIQNTPSHLDISMDHDNICVYPEGDLGVNIVKAILSDSLDEYSLSSVASYAERVGTVWSLETTNGSACSLEVSQASAASVQIRLAGISGYGDVSYRLSCAIAGNTYTATGTVHVASANEARPQPKLLKNYYTTQIGTALTIDASFYDRTTNAKLCSGRDSVWDNEAALAAMGFNYETSGDNWLPVFYEEGSYTTTVETRIGNLKFEEELTVCAYQSRPLPANPSRISIPGALQTIDEEAFCGVLVNVVDLRGGNVRTIGSRAFAECSGLIRVYIPDSITSIAEDAFEGCKRFVIYCTEGSAADTWARQHKIPALYGND